MRKALLVGNGFTLNLIDSYKNEPMMKEFYNRIPLMVGAIEQKFNIFRDLNLSNSDLYNISEALFCGDTIYCGDNLYPSSDGIHIQKTIRQSIIKKLQSIGFHEPEGIFKEYFEDYGLIYSINHPKITGTETYLKVIHMFIRVGDFSEEDYHKVKEVANEIYYNNGEHGLQHINNSSIDLAGLISVINSYSDVFTTNYDTILDDILAQQKRFPYHLHGGFSINHRNKNPDGRYPPNKAKIIWGINSEAKFKELRVGLDFNDIDFSAFSFGDSKLSEYFDYLKDRDYEEIHILGFSGENDDHINQRIKDNVNIKRIIVYVNPHKVNDLETQVRNRILFGNNDKSVNLVSWNDFWELVKNRNP